MDTEIKIAKYLVLTYITYGVMYVFTLNHFIVPLPLLFIALPLLSIYFATRIKFSLETVLILIFPIIIGDEILLRYLSKTVVDILVICGTLTWAVWGGILLFHKKYKTLKYRLLIGVSQILVLLTLVLTQWWLVLGVLGLAGVGAAVMIRKNTSIALLKAELTAALYILTMSMLIFITLLSNFL